MKDLFELAHGGIVPDRLSLFSPVRDEMFFLPAFLSYYRSLGVEQFCFIDDNSSDGSFEYMAAQDDCVVFRSGYGFGEPIRSRTGKKKYESAGIVWKREFPLRYLRGQWALYLDLDEFLHLPPGFATIPALIERLEATDTHSAPAVMVDFYPERPADLAEDVDAKTFEDLVVKYPYFDAEPHIDWPAGERRPTEIYRGTVTRLFQTNGILAQHPAARWLPGALKNILPRMPFRGSTVFKVPLVKWKDGVCYEGSHRLNVPPNTDVLLPLAHFKLCGDLTRRIDDALKTGAYHAGSAKYRGLNELLDMMTRSGTSFLGPNSRLYGGSEAFAECGLAKFDLKPLRRVGASSPKVPLAP